MSILMLIVTLLIGVPAIAGVPVKEESYKKAVAVLEEKGSVPLIDAVSVSEGRGHLEGIRFRPRIISIPTNLNERSDTPIQAVAEVVGGIVTNILDTDDTGQLCWAYITTTKLKDEKVLEACLKYVNSNTATRIKAVDLLLARARVQLTELERLLSTEKERRRREALERQLTDSIQGILNAGHVGIIQRKP